MRDETFAALDRRDGGALHEVRDARGRILDHVLDHLTERGMRRDPADAPASHRPVLGKRVDEQDAVFGVHHVEERRRARPFAIPEARIGLVGDDPETVPAREREQRGEVVARRGPAGRIAGENHKQRARLRRDGGGEPVEIERPAIVAERHRHFDRTRADDAGRGCGIRPGRRRDQHLVAGARDHREHDLDRLHAGAGDIEFLRHERAAVERRVIARERLRAVPGCRAARCRRSRPPQASAWPPRR